MKSLPRILPAVVAALASLLSWSGAQAQSYGHGGWHDYYDEQPERQFESRQYLADRLAQIAALQARQRDLQNQQYRQHARYGVYGSHYPGALAPVNHGTYSTAARFVAPQPHAAIRYQALLDDGFCRIFDISPLDCDCN